MPTESLNKLRSKTSGRVTQRDIAEAVGVSHVAVSHVLHQPHRARISPETRNEILRVARQMGYEPRSATTHTIALVVDSAALWADATTSVLSTADELLREHNYRMSVMTLNGDNIHNSPRLFNQKTVDGVIFTEWYGSKSKCLHSLKVPWLLLADTTETSNVDQISMDTVQTAMNVTDYLIERGHQRLCLVTGAQGVGMHERSRQGVIQALQKAGFSDSNLTVFYDQSGNSIGLEDFLLGELKKKNPPTAIVAGAPGSALTSLNRLHRNGIRVPEDISMISLIDGPRLPAFLPLVSATTALGPDDVRLAINRILQQIKEPGIEPQCHLLAGEVIERDSVRSIA